MIAERRWFWRSLILFACLATVFFLFRDPILYSLGGWLVQAEAPQKADIVVVIGGDHAGNRVLKGAELVREGFAPRLLASGVGAIYGHFESELAVDFAVAHGYPRETMQAFRFPALSTRDEASAVVDELRREGIHKFLLVTSDSHTARAGRVFRRTARDMEVHVVMSANPDWANGKWWTNREGQKLWFNEAVKTLADYVGL